MSGKKEFISGVISNAATKYVGLALQIVVSGYLARMIAPKEFGIVAIVMVGVGFVTLLSEMGVGAAIIQNNNLSSHDLDSIFTMLLIVAIPAVCGYGIFLLICDHYRSSGDFLMIGCVMSLCLIGYIGSIVPAAVLRKQKRFNVIAWSTLIIQFLSGAISVILVYLGFGIVGFLIGQVFFAFGVFFWQAALSRNHPVWPRFSSIRKIARFSFYQFLFNGINYAARNGDTLAVGKFAGVDILGNYDKAYKLMLMPLQQFTHVISPVLQPILNKYQSNPEIIGERYLRIVRISALVAFPASVLMHFGAQDVIRLVNGNNWRVAESVFGILAWSIGPQMILGTSGSIFQSLNKPQILFLTGIFNALCVMFAIIFGLVVKCDILLFSWLLVGAFWISFLFTYAYMFCFLIPGMMWNFIRQLLVPMASAVTLLLGLCFFGTRFAKEGRLISLLWMIGLSVILWLFIVFVTGEYKVVRHLMFGEGDNV